MKQKNYRCKGNTLFKMLFLLLMFFMLSPSKLMAQELISLSVKNINMQELFVQIESILPVRFSFLDQKLDQKKDITLSVQNQSVETILRRVLPSKGFEFIRTGNTFAIKVKNQRTTGPVKKISGTVADNVGEPVIGANVSVKGTTNGTITDVEGNFNLEAASGEILLVSYIGYVSKEIPVSDQISYNVKLTEDTQDLGEVVIVGFGTQKKINLTGSVSALNRKDMEKISVTQTSQLLIGLIGGMNVTQGSSQPGSDGASMRIRGRGTFSGAGCDPLVLVDGLASSIDKVNPTDIENISVLKDAASAAIYGTRAANGVILIETKKGRADEFEISYQGNVGWSHAASKLQIVDSWEHAEMLNEALLNTNGSPQYSTEDIEKFKLGIDQDNYPNARHYDDLITSGSGFRTQHNIGFTGGSKKSTYNISLGYLDQNGIVAETKYQRFNGLINVSSQIRENFKINAKVTGQNGIANEPTALGSGAPEGAEGLVDYSIKIPNFYAGKRSDGYYGNQTGFTIEGWLDSESFIKNTYSTFIGTASLEWNILKNLKLTGLGGYEFAANEYKKFRSTMVIDPYITAGPSDLNAKKTNTSLITLQAYLNYDLTVNNHTLNVLGGYSFESYHNSYTEAYRDNFPSNTLTEINAGSAANQQNSGSAYEWALLSFFGRVNYSYKNRYLLEVNARYDGSSRFPSTKRFGLFPSFSGGWIISQEDFFNTDKVDNLKLRVSYGTLGNQNIGNYPYQQVLTLGLNVPFGVNEKLWSGTAATVVPTTNITWEETNVFDVGIDAGFLRNKLTLALDFYNKKTTGILYNVTASKVLGMTPSVQNAASVLNRGVDITLQHRNSVGDFSYNIAGNFSYVYNKVTSLANLERDVNNGLFVGQSLGTFYGYVTEGLFVDDADVLNYASQPRTAYPGDLKLKDLSGPDGVPDGKVDATYDRTYLGNSLPSFNFGLNMSGSYKNIDLMINGYGVARVKSFPQDFYSNAFYQGSNPQTWMRDRWTKENPNPNAKYPRLLVVGGGEQQFYTSTFTIKNASFFRIKNVQLGYTIPSQLIKKCGMKKIRVYADVNNLLTFDSFQPGLDPEFTTGYPPVREIMAGVNITF